MSDRTVFTVAILGVVVGLAILLVGAQTFQNTIVVSGGLVALASVGLLTYRIGMKEDAEGHAEAH